MDLYNLVVSAKISKGGGGGDEPTGTINIGSNGTYNVKSYASASVSVPVGVFPSGVKEITSNGIYDVETFKSASVSVPQSGITPTGTSSITSNGIYDITSFASVDVNVSGGGGGDHDAEDGIIQKTISGVYTNSRVTSIGSSVFNSCANLTTASFPNVTSIGGYAFYNCTKLSAVYLLAPSIAKMVSSNAFGGTPISKSTYTGSFGSIYVPASLVDSYKSAANWSTYADRITSYVE